MPTILIVEDEPIPALNMARTLGDLGYRVTARAANAAEALFSARHEMPDLALVDIVLGGREDGIALAHTLREEGLRALIFTTSFADPATVRRATTLRPNGYLVKPFGRDELFAAVETAIAQIVPVQPEAPDAKGLAPHQLNATLDYIAKNFDRDLSVVDLARRVGLSTSHFTALFRRSTGKTPIEHITNERMAEAKRLLRATDWPMSRVATAVGFENQSYFSTRFKAEVGVAPMRYRRCA